MTDTLLRTATSETFADRVARVDPSALRAADIGTLMLNVTLRCDMACPQCHQSSSPQRIEQMSRDNMLDALRFARIVDPALIDVTGGEPALWPHLPEFLALARDAGHALRVRTNLSALARPESAGLPELLARHGVAILGSLPDLDPTGGAGPVGLRPPAALEALRALADLGYGSGDGLVLDLAHSPQVGQLPRDERKLAEEMRVTLGPLGVRFDTVREIANVAVGRLGRRLELEGTHRAHLAWLADGFNPAVLGALACRHGIDVAWDGTLYDCDFNMGAGVRTVEGPRSLREALELDASGEDMTGALASRRIALRDHCFACTVGSGSG